MQETATLEKPVEGRKGDAVLRIAQDNEKRALIIEDINPSALSWLGYAPDEVKGRKFEVLLGHESALVIDEELEYDDAAPDMADIFAKYRTLRLRLRNGQEINAAYRIHRLLAENHQSHFQVILPNDRDDRARQNLREFLKTNFEGHQQLDPVTGLPNRATMEATIARLKNFSSETDSQICVATLRLDRFEKSVAQYGVAASQDLLRHVVNCCRSTFRSEDIIGSLDQQVALLLINLSRESARVVLNRLRWNIGSHAIEFGGKANFSVTVSLAFDMLSEDNSGEILKICEEAVIGIDTNARNAFVELGQP